MSMIDSTARIADGAVIAEGVTIGPYCIIGPNVTIGADCTLHSHVNIAGHTTLGSGCVVFPFASLGTAPQDLGYRDEPTRLEIGDRCTIRESVTMNCGTVKGGGVTRVGNDGFFMSYSHVGHDCVVGNNAIFANSATLGGHCLIGDFVYIGGLTAVHQFTRIGSQAMVAGVTGVRGDVIPYGFATGQHAYLNGLNVIGMRRRKFTKARLHAVRSFYNALFFGAGTFAERLEQTRPMANDDPAIAEIIAFVDANDKRPLARPFVESSEAHE
ncbi:MAG: acyl-ACP--UDP-N-acetylglucosamine O-acyltransferase [Xanthobacteraceae bacterium]|nr:acyl-ACP--UDP-N-acetylglucosamine O-acyltransferase [Xanthobacteraceae bacterium]